MKTVVKQNALGPIDTFARRHLGSNDDDIARMLQLIGYESLEALVDAAIPQSIRMPAPLALDAPADSDSRGEAELLAQLKQIAGQNRVLRSCIGMGYYDCITPPVIARNILENPSWYTQYTPYQSEIAQGRLEALLNFQTMVGDLTGMPLSNSSLLDEATAAAEAMAMCVRISRGKKPRFFIADDSHPQTIEVVRTRATSMNVELVVGDPIAMATDDVCGVLIQYPNTDGQIADADALDALAQKVHQGGAMLVVATDLLALTLLRPPGEFGADIVIGSAQRFGVPMGFGGPHAAFLATSDKHVRKMPGRIVGVSKDRDGRDAYRLTIQTREQHIRRETATSNICTAQVLLAIMAGMYAVYHGPQGLRRIATRVHTFTRLLARGLGQLGFELPDEATFFDTLRISVNHCKHDVAQRAVDAGINLRSFANGDVGVSLDESADVALLESLLGVFAGGAISFSIDDLAAEIDDESLEHFGPSKRASDYLTHPIFNSYHCETEMLRYLKWLESRDLSLANSMISLGSCTMKLNATSEMIPITWPQFAHLHPFAPKDQTKGYAQLFEQLERWLAQITGFSAVSLQPNAGSQGEYAGLLLIRAFHESRGDTDRKVCLIPVSAHGTNPASAVIAGFEVVAVNCDADGNIDVDDLQAKAREHADRLGALMITYPSTHGVFEEAVGDICAIIHEYGGRVYLDGANLNALVGLCQLAGPHGFGADVCHINLHKTFCIPHGGGGPGMGPIACTEQLAPFLPGHPVSSPDNAGEQAIGPVSAAPYGSPSILPIPWVYIALMGAKGLTKATEVAILNANYMAKRLQDDYNVLFTGPNGCVAHEFILDCRHFHVSAAIEVEDIAKRLMDYGFHAPTMSWPVPGTLMIEPTESESKAELDRFCDALIQIRAEIAQIEQANANIENNVLKNAPHPIETLASNDWPHPYTREDAAYPLPWLRQRKFWPPVGRIDNPYGDRHLVCSCPPMRQYT